RWYHCIDRAIRWPDGRWLRCEIAIDITERKQKEEKYKKLSQKLKKINQKLKYFILKDPLTGFYNHRYLEERIEAEFQYAKRFHRALSVIFIDIDYFKSINELCGHKFGDKVLLQFAKRIRKSTRKYDVCVRFGGEEFIILCQETEKPNAVSLAKRILNEINLVEFGDKKRKVKLSLSIAVVNYPESKVIRGIELVNLAERLINKAKEKGGNRVFVGDNRYSRASLSTENSSSIPSQISVLKKRLIKLMQKTRRTVTETILAFAKTIQLKDHYTGEHVEKTVYYATKIAETLGLSEREIELIREAAMLHDLGKIGISEKILLKKGKLTEREYEEVKK
ncbi:MAG: diguanylate cyclase, partial [Candidatus Omnitrophica bacterium]|nr:diguanylate cyclase [Candidatus Omnitrophota bacterium]